MRPFTDIEITEVNDDTEDGTYSSRSIFFHVSPFFFVFFFHFFRSFFFPFFLSFFFHEFCLVRGCKRVERVDVDLTLAGFSSLNGRRGDANFQKREYLYIYIWDD